MSQNILMPKAEPMRADESETPRIEYNLLWCFPGSVKIQISGAFMSAKKHYAMVKIQVIICGLT